MKVLTGILGTIFLVGVASGVTAREFPKYPHLAGKVIEGTVEDVQGKMLTINDFPCRVVSGDIPSIGQYAVTISAVSTSPTECHVDVVSVKKHPQVLKSEVSDDADETTPTKGKGFYKRGSLLTDIPSSE